MQKPKTMVLFISFCIIFVLFFSCTNHQTRITEVEQWQEIELNFTAEKQYPNPYTDVEFRVEFSGSNGEKIVRPGFWDDKNNWKVRFASPTDSGAWTWKSFANDSTDKGLNGRQGTLISKSYKGANPLIKNGLLRMSPKKRNIVHANGMPFLMIGDTPWALPWRGTIESVTEYAQNRQERGFNAALLMSLLPDRAATGPRNRTESGGFDVAFEDLKDGHINNPNPAYFQYLDTLRNILVDHGIVPVFQPVFHGFGWKGLNVLGWNVDPTECARYCRYLVARYGAKPAMWLVGADSDGRNADVKTSGEAIEKWDTYQQPTGIHYSPFDDYTPDWWNRPEKYIPHLNKMHQEAEWLDFQWCQTGHGGAHLPHKVAKMHDNLPTKAVANGEPTYEGIRDSLNGAGWWQGHEAWLQFTSGGTMGVVYGAGGLWNWKLFKDEPGWPDWANSNVSWKEAIRLPGAIYPGYLRKALDGLDITDIEKHPELANGQLCLAKPGVLYIVYLPEGGEVHIAGLTKQMQYQWFNPVTGNFEAEGVVQAGNNDFYAGGKNPKVLIIKEKK